LQLTVGLGMLWDLDPIDGSETRTMTNPEKDPLFRKYLAWKIDRLIEGIPEHLVTSFQQWKDDRQLGFMLLAGVVLTMVVMILSIRGWS
jgi:hypothetical protein